MKLRQSDARHAVNLSLQRTQLVLTGGPSTITDTPSLALQHAQEAIAQRDRGSNSTAPLTVDCRPAVAPRHDSTTTVMAACLFKNCSSSARTVNVRAVRPFGPKHSATAVSQQRLAQQQRRLRSLSIVCSFDGDAGKALKEAAALDELIDVMLEAKSQQELSRLVAENIFSFDAKFWMRIATRNDSLNNEAEKDKLKAVADTVMVLVDAMVKQTEQQLNDSAGVLQEVLKAAADERGEWYLPLDKEQVSSVRAALERYSDRLDEALLSNCFAWMKKCQDDRMDTMVALLQKVLQLYAAKALRGQEAEGVAGVLNEVVFAEEQEWEPIIRRAAATGEVAEAAFMEVLQKKMEATVLGMQSGSYAQRVQAEYLKEVEARAKTVFRQLAAAQ
eukprot:GHRQ01010644.1.p1 GENE.GHRQ01010644.1~~GHRQ01010644.1.p1  ORF type:complete len:389 (+),score=148.19 GHRQ01010644.1:331-1497(+)